jgi:outer membrane protein assembly factor BamD
MNRLTKKIAVVVLAVLVLGAVSVQARERRQKKKKQVDLSVNPLAGVNSKQPDKELYDKAMIAMKKGRFDVARLDLQTMLNTYPESEYRMRAKLAVGDTWFKEGGAAPLTQAEAEYKDFITFFPTAPEAAEAQMKVADIYYQQMEKPDRDYNNTQRAEQEYRAMINQFPESTLVPRAKQKLRDVQEVLAERETQIGLFYVSRDQFAAAVARLQTVVDTYPLYSKSDQALLGIGNAYLGEARGIEAIPHLPAAIKERMRAVYQDKAAAAFAKVITRYPMAPHVEDARDQLVAMNRTVPEPTQEALAENDAEERSRQPLHFTGKTLGFIKHGPTVVEAVHVGEPSLEDPKRTLAPDINRQNMVILADAINAGRPGAPTPGTIQPTAANEPPRSDQPNSAPLLTPSSEGGTGVGVSIVSAPSGTAATGASPVLKPVGPASTELPAAESPAQPPTQVNDIKSAGATATPITPPGARKVKKPKADLGDESSSKKKKKKGIDKLNPF